MILTLLWTARKQSVTSTDISFDLKLEAAGGKFRFLIRDAEWSTAPGSQADVKIHQSQSNITSPYLGAVGAARYHDSLFAYSGYKQAFQARMALHFGAGGIMGPVTAGNNPLGDLWQEMADDVDPIVRAESARWGDSATATARLYGTQNSGQGTWLGNIAYQRDTWIPERRVHYLQTLYQYSLADPANHPDVPPLP